jgi:hypothetical protein
MKTKILGVILGILLVFSLIPIIQAAVSVSISQAGADSNTVMKGKAFTVTVSGLSGSGTVTLIDLPTGISPIGESISKSFSTSSISWTTVTASQKISNVKIKVSVSVAGSPSTAESSLFDVILPPSIVASSTPASFSNPTGSETISLNVQNWGETIAKSVTATISLPAGVSLSSGYTATQNVGDISGGAGGSGESKSVSWKLDFINPSSSNIQISITPSNADSKSLTIPITITAVEEEVPSAVGVGVGIGIVPAKIKNATRRPSLVPGVELINNTKLQSALEKVLGIAKLSQQAIDNLLKISQSITQDIDVIREFKAEANKSKLSMRMEYKGDMKITNFIVYDLVPKGFAEHADNITVTAPGAKVEIVEPDPEYAFLYPELNPDQVITITYETSGEKDPDLINETRTEVYAESLEEFIPAAEVCTPHEKRCIGNDLQQCSADGSKWESIQICEYGCNPATLICNAKPITPVVIVDYTWIWILIAIIIVLIVVYKKVKIKTLKI